MQCFNLFAIHLPYWRTPNLPSFRSDWLSRVMKLTSTCSELHPFICSAASFSSFQYHCQTSQAVGMMLIPMEAMPGYVMPVQEMCYPQGAPLRNLVDRCFEISNFWFCSDNLGAKTTLCHEDECFTGSWWRFLRKQNKVASVPACRLLCSSHGPLRPLSWCNGAIAPTRCGCVTSVQVTKFGFAKRSGCAFEKNSFWVGLGLSEHFWFAMKQHPHGLIADVKHWQMSVPLAWRPRLTTSERRHPNGHRQETWTW